MNFVSSTLALVAQWLEHWSYEPGVGGSNPPLSIAIFATYFNFEELQQVLTHMKVLTQRWSVHFIIFLIDHG